MCTRLSRGDVCKGHRKKVSGDYKSRLPSRMFSYLRWEEEEEEGLCKMTLTLHTASTVFV